MDNKSQYVIPVSPEQNSRVSEPVPAPEGLKSPNDLKNDGASGFVASNSPEEMKEKIQNALTDGSKKDFQLLLSAGLQPNHLGFELDSKG
jgi:hypothetical protein